jgi:hypothetical protein
VGPESQPTGPNPLLYRGPGRCHNAYCDEKATFVVRVRRIGMRWTTGVDYCEQHAHEAAQRMREQFKVVVEPK